MAVGELHEEIFYAGTDVGEVPLGVFDHCKAGASNGQMRFVNDGSQDAVYVGGAFGVTPTLASEWVTDDFIVVEPIELYPGGGRWQLALIRDSATTIKAILAPDGGWSSTTVTPANNYGFGDGLAGSPVITDPVAFIQTALLVSGSLRISSCNLDTYDSGTKRYTHFRIFPKPTGVSAADEVLRVGGFVPTNIVAETKPVVLLIGEPTTNTAVADWGCDDFTSNLNFNRTPYEYPPRTLQMNGDRVSSATCKVAGLSLDSYSTDRSNQAVALTLRLESNSDQKQLGSFGSFDIKTISDSLTNYDTDTAVNYFIHGPILLRYNP